MRKSTMLALALASTAFAATPAAATTDNAGYFGIEAGLWFPSDTDIEVDSDDDFFDYDLDIEHKMGFDGDIIGGYDFGQFRAELELAYKSAGLDGVEADFGDGSIEVDADGDVSVWSIMGNVLWNPTFSDRWDAYLGGGIGWAWTKFEPDFEGDEGDDFKDNAFAWQLIAGVGYQISDSIELGLKYRYFQTKFSTSDDIDVGDGFVDVDIDGQIHTHSLLASVIFGFGSAPPPPLPTSNSDQAQPAPPPI